MADFYIEKLLVKGAGKKDAVAEFDKELTIISGPFNTGKTTIILTTHYLEEAELLSDRIAIMKNGKLLCVGTADEIKLQAGADRFEEAFVKLVTKGIS